jgi:hypothetical protein
MMQCYIAVLCQCDNCSIITNEAARSVPCKVVQKDYILPLFLYNEGSVAVALCA